MKYYCLLKMYKINYVFYDYRCEEVKKKMLKLIEKALGNKHNEYAELLKIYSGKKLFKILANAQKNKIRNMINS